MELQYFGANCIKLSTKKATLVIDDNLSDLGLSSVTKPGDIALFTGVHPEPSSKVKLVIDSPGEFEVSDISIHGITARAHMDEADQKNVTMYNILVDDIRVAIIGHIYPELCNEQLEALGTVDVMCIPVGGNGYTLDAVGALTIIKEVEPKIIIPTHYDDKKLKYPVPQQDLETALKNLAMEPQETVAKLKLKPADITDTTKFIILERQ